MVLLVAGGGSGGDAASAHFKDFTNNLVSFKKGEENSKGLKEFYFRCSYFTSLCDRQTVDHRQLVVVVVVVPVCW